VLVGLALELAEKTGCNLTVLVEVVFAKVAKVAEVGKVLEKMRRLAIGLEVDVGAPLALELGVSEALEGFAFQEAEVVLA
jgi:hypothetical protein